VNPKVGFQGSVRNARGELGAWGGTLDWNERLDDGWTQVSVLRVKRMLLLLLLTSTVTAWDRTWSQDSALKDSCRCWWSGSVVARKHQRFM
jgi:hypothetical protein